MHNITRNVINLAFGINDGDELSTQQEVICNEWATGVGHENMKINIDDPKLLQCINLFSKCVARATDLSNDLF